MPITQTCTICGCNENVRQRAIASFNGNRPVSLCENCRDRISFPCYQCGERYPNESSVIVEGHELCTHCFSSYYFSCHACGESTSRNAAYELGRIRNGDRRIPILYCHECYLRESFQCENCHVRYQINRRSTNDESLCVHCAAASPVMSKTFKNNPSHRTVGFELEYHIDCDVDLYQYGEIKDDGSVRAPFPRFSQEFASYPTNGDNLLTTVTNVCRALNAAGAEVNATCGFHVHIGVRDFTKEQRENIKQWWRLLEKIFLATVAPSRRGNQYSKNVDGLRPITRWNSDRYVTMNITALEKHGTFEFRLHQGTLNAGKIKSWIQLLLAFVDVYSKVTATDQRISRVKKLTARGQLIFLFQQLNLPIKTRKFIVSRIREFGPYIDIKTKKPTFSKRMSKSKKLLLEHFGDPIGNVDLRITEDEIIQTQPIMVPPLPPERMYFYSPTATSWAIMPEELLEEND